MVYKIKNVQDHVEVYDNQGHFLFSADNQQEALDEMLLIEPGLQGSVAAG